MPIAELVRDYVQAGGSARPLMEELRSGVQWATQSYSDAYFELGERGPDAIPSLACEVFHICAHKKMGRTPFAGREPFRAYVEERFEDPPIRLYTFYGRLSITKTLLHKTYHRNVRRSLVLRWNDALYREIGDILEAHCEPVSVGPRTRPRWRCEEAGVLPPEIALTSITRELSPSDWSALRAPRGARREVLTRVVCRFLGLCDRPMSQTDLSNLLADRIRAFASKSKASLDDPGIEGREEMTTGDTRNERDDAIAIRRAVRKAWLQLGPLERAVFLAAAAGEPATALISRFPELTTKVAVSNAIARTNRVFIDTVVADLGIDPDPAVTPRAMLELISAVLRRVLPELTYGT